VAGPIDRLRELWFGSRLYAATLGGGQATARHAPDDPWPGETEDANAIFQGRYLFGGEPLLKPNQSPWGIAASPDALAALHGFDWLRHLAQAGGPTAQRLARSLIEGWIESCGRWQAETWRADLLGRRLFSWSTQSAFLLAGAEAAFIARFLASWSEQARHLERVAEEAADGAPRLTALAALGLSGLALSDGDARLERALAALARELPRQVLADGCHVERRPSTQLGVLRELVALKRGLIGMERAVPAALGEAIDRLAPMLRFFRMGDGALAGFHGGQESSRDLIDLTLAKSDAKGKAPDSAPEGGFERLAAGRSTIVVDTGWPAAGAWGRAGHAGCLAFEMSHGRDRMIVNCGMAAEAGPAWKRALRSTAAHSTLVLDEHDSLELTEDGVPARQPPRPRIERKQADGAVWLDAAHEGYRARLGVVHQRRLFLDTAGEDLRGEDSILPEGGTGRAQGKGFALRFHLHPKVQASLIGEGDHALLKLPGGSGWIFRAAGGSIGLEESVYFADGGQRRRAEQLVVSGQCGEGATSVKWRLSAIAPP